MDIYGYNFRVVNYILMLDKSILIKSGIYGWDYLDSFKYDDSVEITSLDGFLIPSNNQYFFEFDNSHLNLRMSELTTDHINSVLEELGGNFWVEHNI